MAKPEIKIYKHSCRRCLKPIETTDISEWVCKGSCRAKLRAEEPVSDYPTVAEAKRAGEILNRLLKKANPTSGVYFNPDKDYT